MKFLIQISKNNPEYFGGYTTAIHTSWKCVDLQNAFKFKSLKKARRCIKFHSKNFRNPLDTYNIKLENAKLSN